MSTAHSPLFHLRDATVMKDGNAVLNINELLLWQGEHVAVVGPNGAGKSTLIDVMTRETRPLATQTGSPIEMLGQTRWDLFEARRVFGVVSPSLAKRHARHVTVRENVMSGFFGSVAIPPHRSATPSMEERADELMISLDIEHLAQRTMATLSTGEARRALVARALAHDPEALILDEPCDGLDVKARAELIATMRGLATAGHTLVLVTHHVSDIIPEIERVIMLKNGVVAGDGTTDQMLTNERLSALFEMDVQIERRGEYYSIAE